MVEGTRAFFWIHFPQPLWWANNYTWHCPAAKAFCRKNTEWTRMLYIPIHSVIVKRGLCVQATPMLVHRWNLVVRACHGMNCFMFSTKPFFSFASLCFCGRLRKSTNNVSLNITRCIGICFKHSFWHIVFAAQQRWISLIGNATLHFFISKMFLVGIEYVE